MPTYSHTPMCATHPRRASLTHVTLPSTHMQTGTHPHTTHLHCTFTTTHTSHLCPHSSRLHPHVHTHPLREGTVRLSHTCPFADSKLPAPATLHWRHLPYLPLFPQPCVPIPLSFLAGPAPNPKVSTQKFPRAVDSSRVSSPPPSDLPALHEPGLYEFYCDSRCILRVA